MAPELDRIERALERFIVGELLEDVYDGRDPLAADAVDSLGIEQLVEYLEEEFEVSVADTEIVRENFESIPALAAFIQSKREAANA